MAPNRPAKTGSASRIRAADPLYSQSVPVLGSIGIESTGLSAVAARVGAHFSPEPALLLLAIVGLGVLLVRRQWAIAIGTAALSAGVLLFLLYLGMRNVYVSGRYVAPVDVAVTFAAGLGAASVLAPGVRFFHEPDRQLVGLHLLVGAIVAVALLRPLGPLDPSQRNEISSNGAVHRDLAQVTPVLQREIAAQGVVPWPTTGSPTKPMGSDAILLAPILTVPQLAVDLDLPLSAILGTTAESIASDGSYPRPGQIVFHDVDRDSPPTAFRVFEVNQTTHIGSITIEPIFVDPRGRFWVLRIR